MPMRPVTVRCDAAEFSRWVPVNFYSSAFGIGFGVKLEDGATLTYTVQHTFDDLYEKRNCTIARVTTTATVTLAGHGLSVGDWVYITNAGAPFDGEFAVASVVNVNSFTYTVPNSGATASGGNTKIQTARVFPHSEIADETASADGNYEFPPRAIRLNVSAYTDGFAELTIISGGK